MDIPLEMIFLKRRLIDRANPSTVLGELKESHPEVSTPDAFKRYVKTISSIPEDFFGSSNTSSIISDERRRCQKKLEVEGINLDDIPYTPDMQKSIDRVRDLFGERVLLDSRPGGLGIGRGGGSIHLPDEDTMEILRNIKPSSDGLSYFDKTGKHLYIHHGWREDDFSRHPDSRSREIAHQLIHQPLVAQQAPSGVVDFDDAEWEQRLRQSSKNTPDIYLASPTDRMVGWHMRVMHGQSGGHREHEEAHRSGDTNHHHIWNY